MADFETLRQRMVDNQIRPSEVTDYDVIRAFLNVPREIFVADDETPFAYADRELKMAGSVPNRRMLGPVSVARLVHTLRGARDRSKALVVGCGSGYSSAILARLFSEVVALEEDAALAALARDRLQAVGAANVSVVEGRLAAGWPGGAPYDAVLVEGAVEVVPEPLIGQLGQEGLLATIERNAGVSRAVLYERVGDTAAKRRLFDAWATPLPGFERPREFVF
jgi:protein-L-isoaspartate(D-aspartate) O-methyltransferase